MAKNKNGSRLARLNVFANSPKVVKLFGSFVAMLMVVAVGYGGYVLISEQFGSAAQKYTWYYNSPSIRHQGGHVVKDLKNSGDGQLHGAVGPDWEASEQFGDGNKYVWYGPGVNLKPGKQYLGCFFYQFISVAPPASATLDIYNTSGGRVFNKYEVYLDSNTSGNKNLTYSTYSKGKFARTCLAFYVPSYAKGNQIDLRVKLNNSSAKLSWVAVRATKITEVNDSDRKLPNLWMLKNPEDNSTILHGSSYSNG